MSVRGPPPFTRKKSMGTLQQERGRQDRGSGIITWEQLVLQLLCGSQQRGQSGDIWHTEREGQRGLLEVLCLCPPGKRVLVLGEVLGPDLITPCVAPRMQPQL